MLNLLNNIQNFLLEIVLLLAAISLGLIIAISILWSKFTKVNSKYQKIMKGMAGKNFEDMLLQMSEKSERLDKDLKKLLVEQISLKDNLRKCISKVGVVRYNAFNEMGSDLSFSVAFLDEDKNGLVITSLYGRSDCRTYAKPIDDGTSTYALSDEEYEALKKALI